MADKISFSFSSPIGNFFLIISFSMSWAVWVLFAVLLCLWLFSALWFAFSFAKEFDFISPYGEWFEIKSSGLIFHDVRQILRDYLLTSLLQWRWWAMCLTFQCFVKIDSFIVSCWYLAGLIMTVSIFFSPQNIATRWWIVCKLKVWLLMKY